MRSAESSSSEMSTGSEHKNNKTTKTSNTENWTVTEEISDKEHDEIEKEEDTKWAPSDRILSPNDKRKLIAKVVDIAITSIMGNHYYQFAGKIYNQTRGGAIGLRLTGLVCKIVMDRWFRMMEQKLGVNKWTFWLLKKYVDDINIFCEALGKRVRYVKGKLIWSKANEIEDEKGLKSDTKRTMEQFEKIANEFHPSLQFKMDTQEDHSNGRVPMLDVAVWSTTVKDCTRIGGTKQQVNNAFYEKECVSSKVLEYYSAIQHRCKIITLSQEVI